MFLKILVTLVLCVVAWTVATRLTELGYDVSLDMQILEDAAEIARRMRNA